jgi:hypothetical protein
VEIFHFPDDVLDIGFLAVFKHVHDFLCVLWRHGLEGEKLELLDDQDHLDVHKRGQDLSRVDFLGD